MASLERRGDIYRIVFRHQGRKYQPSLGTGDRELAENSLARVEVALFERRTDRRRWPYYGVDWFYANVTLDVINKKKSNDKIINVLGW